MYRTKTDTKLVWWPTPQDYNEAIQIPLASLNDPELKTGLPYTNALELPRSITGSFASVYRMHCKKKDFALRLFLSNIRDQHERYALISNFVQHDDLPYTVTFDFLKEGIKIHGEWLPALKMDWLEGAQLDDYIVDNLAKPDKIGKLLDKFVTMMRDLRRAGIAHGDLQHGNILVCNGELRLVDYDGMFVPAMKGFSAGELGHRNYQHPERAAHHFGPYLDNFSAWVIYASLRALQIDSRLMHQLGGGDDCLLFRQVDFTDPLNSPAFAALEQHADPRLKELGRFVRAQLNTDLQNIPYLELPLKNVQELKLNPVSEAVPVVKSGARIVRGNLPDWLQNENATVLSTAKIGHLDGADSASKEKKTANSAASTSASTGTNVPPKAAPQSWTVPPKPAQNAAWIKPGAPAHAHRRQVAGGKLNKIIANFNAAAQIKQHQQSAAQRTAAKQTASQFHSTTAAFTTTPANLLKLPVELQVTTIPRPKVKWNPRSGRLDPREPLCMMVFNPVIWMMIYLASHAMGVGSELTARGVMVPATVYYTEHHSGSGYTNIGYHYNVNNHTYFGQEQRSDGAKQFERGDGYQIGVLPDNPLVHEALNKPLGAKGNADAFFCFLCFAFNSILIGALLWSPLKDRRLAKLGHPLVASIDSLRTVPVPKGVPRYFADISFEWAGATKYHTISLLSSQYATLNSRTSEVILYDEKTDTPRLYAFCRYHPVITLAVNSNFP